MELIAKVAQVMPLESGTSRSSGNPWQKCQIIVEWTEGQFTKKLAISNMKKAAEFATLQPYQEYKFKIDVTSREYNGKWYTEATCFGWEPIAMATPAPAPQQQYNPTNAVGAPTAPGYAAQPAYPPQPGAPQPQPYAPAPAPAYNPNQAPYGYPQPAPSPQDPPF